MKILLLAVLVVLSGCSSISKEECVKGDWKNLGFKDAMNGKTDYRDGSYAKDCSEHGVNVDKSGYRNGFDEGLKSYCTSRRGEQLGEKGAKEHYLCAKISTEFSKGYTKGYEKYKLELAKKQALKDLKKKMITMYGTKECKTSADCGGETITGKCQYGSCTHGGKTCNFDSDCQIQVKSTKACVPITDRTEYNERVMVHMCTR